jgi:acetylornithine deacetylase/succinyl-diaminopimelate desuccinylase-like protein
MDARDDALAKAAEFVLRARDAARAIDGTVATVGRIEVEPGAANVIPGRARLTVDVRAPDEDRLTRLLETLGLEAGYDLAPVELDDEIRGVLRDEIAGRSLPVVELPSGAGHDAGVLAARGVETGMLFVRSLNGGISHSPDELTSDEDITLALDVLTGTLRRLAS